jgi:hypothetical protein
MVIRNVGRVSARGQQLNVAQVARGRNGGATPERTMPRRKVPAAVLTIAVLHFVFGGLGLICLGCGGLMALAGGQQALARMGTPEQQRQAEAQRRRQQVMDQVHAERVPLYRAYSTTNQVASVLFCVAMVASGFGLLYLRPWGRWLSVGYASLSLLANVGVALYTLAFMAPADEEAFRRVPPQSEQERMAYNLARVAAPFGGCVTMIYPAAVLVVMLLPSIGRAFQVRHAGKRGRRRFNEDDEDPDDDYRVRRRPRR